MRKQIIGNIASRAILMTGILVGLMLSSCKKDDPEPVDPLAVSRTVLVYMAANNSLGSSAYDDLDLDEMQQAVDAGSLHGGRLLVFHAPWRSSQSLIEITEQGKKTLKTYSSDKSSVSPERMSEVLSDVRILASADDYGLVLWSHGTGWGDEKNSRSASTRAWGVDDSYGSQWMKVSTLADVIENSNLNPSFIYFDACLMGTIEVAYEMRRCTPEIIASGTETRVYGMPYQLNVPVFFAKNRNLEDAARNTFEDYQTGKYDNGATDCSISLIRTHGLEDLAAATRRIMETGAMPKSTYKPVKYGWTSYGIYDMPDYIKALPVDTDMKTAWTKAFNRVVPYFAATAKYGSYDLTNFGGLGCYILDSPADAQYMGYDTYEWWKDVVSANPSLNPAD